MTALTRDTLVEAIDASLTEEFSEGGVFVVADNDRLIVFSPGGKHYAVTVQEVGFSPARAARKKAAT